MENFPKELFASKDVAGFEKYIIDNGISKDDWLTTNHHTLLLYTLLYKKYKDYEMSKMLIKYFDINNQDREGKTVLFHAVIMGNVPAVKFFVVNGGDVLIKDNAGRKAADYAAMLDIENNQTISRTLLSEESKAKKKA